MVGDALPKWFRHCLYCAIDKLIFIYFAASIDGEKEREGQRLYISAERPRELTVFKKVLAGKHTVTSEDVPGSPGKKYLVATDVWRDMTAELVRFFIVLHCVCFSFIERYVSKALGITFLAFYEEVFKVSFMYIFPKKGMV